MKCNVQSFPLLVKVVLFESLLPDGKTFGTGNFLIVSMDCCWVGKSIPLEPILTRLIAGCLAGWSSAGNWTWVDFPGRIVSTLTCSKAFRIVRWVLFPKLIDLKIKARETPDSVQVMTPPLFNKKFLSPFKSNTRTKQLSFWKTSQINERPTLVNLP